uniref:Large ribosomal subunit protein mL38 n=1 Tax=Meloidogyne hapla TaxID=6305 RepID=A0A1I8BCU4_MELHA
MYKPSIYANLYVKHSRRAKNTPRVARPWRPRVVAWAGPDAFIRNRFYEFDNWYKARIHKPELLPKLHLIDPDTINESFEEKIKDDNQKKNLINIGFKRLEQNLTKLSSEDLTKLENLAIKNKLFLDFNKIDSSNQLTLFEHFNIFDDLFMPGVYFYNVQNLDIFWNKKEENTKIYFGNIIKAIETTNPPNIKIGNIFNNENKKEVKNGFNTLLMLNLEGPGLENEEKDFQNDEQKQLINIEIPEKEELLIKHLNKNKQIIHWFVGNIPLNGEINDGNTLINYIQPMPFYGTGYHRFVFILFKHMEIINFEKYFLNCDDFSSFTSRIFNTNSFYKNFEDKITPSSLRFCQIKWDLSCDKTLNSLGVKSPRYWYEWNKPLKPEQKEFPL